MLLILNLFIHRWYFHCWQIGLCIKEWISLSSPCLYKNKFSWGPEKQSPGTYWRLPENNLRIFSILAHKKQFGIEGRVQRLSSNLVHIAKHKFFRISHHLKNFLCSRDLFHSKINVAHYWRQLERQSRILIAAERGYQKQSAGFAF